MSIEYQVLARKFRPQSFKNILGQNAIVQTLKNAIKNHRLAHAYIFCGSRGTGKTTLARVFAKALNCSHPTADFEPCNECSSCKEITSGNSLDVLEIDGASHRGIDDIRQINETVGYTASSGKYKIYIIDEVHMLTKEAFNALLKTLEEPPPKVKFFFATTEPHKVLPTILSRCQRFNLNRIPLENIISKLKYICDQQQIQIEGEAIRLLAQRAEGGLRDAESLLDQIIAFHEGAISAASIAEILGIMPKQVYFELDKAGKEGNLAKAFEVAEQVFSQGKDLTFFLEGLADHFRTLSIVKISGKGTSYLNVLPEEYVNYETSAKLYTQEQCMNILDMLTDSQQQIRFMPSPRIALEAVLLKILRIHQRLPIEFLIRRLSELEKLISASTDIQQTEQEPSLDTEPVRKEIVKTEEKQVSIKTPSAPNAIKDFSESILPAGSQGASSVTDSTSPIETTTQKLSITEDPNPTEADLGKRKTTPSIPKAVNPVTEHQPNEDAKKKQSCYDTLLQFAAVELEGTIQRKPQFGK